MFRAEWRNMAKQEQSIMFTSSSRFCRASLSMLQLISLNFTVRQVSSSRNEKGKNSFKLFFSVFPLPTPSIYD